MTLEVLPQALTVCRTASMAEIDTNGTFFFIGRTDEEISLVCRPEEVPAETIAREDGWRAFRIQGPLDFSLVGILAKISGVLAKSRISIFAVSTYNTDYVLIKEEHFDRALTLLSENGFEIERLP